MNRHKQTRKKREQTRNTPPLWNFGSHSISSKSDKTTNPTISSIAFVVDPFRDYKPVEYADIRPNILYCINWQETSEIWHIKAFAIFFKRSEFTRPIHHMIYLIEDNGINRSCDVL